MISQSFLMQLKSICDIETIMSSYVELKRAGRYLKCNCPFHLEKTPSCVVYQDTQSFYCFGCGAGGDVITFIMKIENLTYIEAVRFLAQRAGLQMPEDTDERSEQRAKQKTRIFEMNKLAAKFYHQQLKLPEGKEGLQYFAQRRLSKKTIITYGLGYAPKVWDSLYNYLRSEGYSASEMLAADLVAKSKNGNYYDKFRGRVIFPIIDLRGNIIAFGGRVLGDGKPKYLNTSDTPVFKKSKNLFSLNFAKNSGEKTILLGEGYMDVISMYQAGFHNAVATLGTALTAEQARLISRYCEDIVIAYDSDTAGSIATEKASKLFESTGLKARVLHMTGAKDPDEYIKKFGAGKFQILIDEADSVFSSKTQRIKEKYNLEDPDEKISFIRENCEMISRMEDPVQADVYLSKLSSETGTPKEILKIQVENFKKNAYRRLDKEEWKTLQRNSIAPRDKINPQSTKYPKAAYAEQGIIFFLYHNPDYLQKVQDLVSSNDFVTELHRRVFDKICEQIKGHLPLDLGMFQSDFSEEEMGRIAAIVNDNQRHSNDEEYLNSCASCLISQKGKLDDEARKNLTLEEMEKRRLKQREEKR